MAKSEKTAAVEAGRKQTAGFDPIILGLIVSVVITAFIIFAKPISGLSAQGHVMLGATLLGLSFWIFRPSTLPYFVGGAIILTGALLLKLPFDVVFKGYTSPAVWVLIPALFYGFALMKTGLGKRIAYAVLKTFQPSYMGLTFSWFIIGLLLSALTPSITVRIAIVMPIAISLVEACKLPDRSKGAAYICFVAFATALLPGIGWQTGSLWGIFMMGFYPPEIRAIVTPGMWFEYMAFPWFFITVLFLGLLYFAFKPAEPLQLSREAFKDQYAALGKITRDEIVTAVILTGALILFSTDKWTGIKTPEAALMGFMALMLFGIIKISDIGTGVNWDIINFFGVVVGLSAMFGKAGVSDWAKPIIEPAVLSMASSPLVFLLLLTLVLWAIRFIDIPWGFTTFAILSPVFIPLLQKFGLNPVMVSIAFIAAGNSFFLAYQQPFIMLGDGLTKSRGWTGAQVSTAGLLYAIAIIVGIIVSTFYWKAMGLMPA
ncbi:MAG: SLC13 family permease [Syntrophobacteraceae bacterium]